MGLLTHTFGQVAEIVVFTVDKHGDQVMTSTTETVCRFRYITDIDRGLNREGVQSSDAIIWFEPDEDIEEGSIVLTDGQYWRVDKLIRARKMSGSTVEFLKAFVKRHSIVNE